MNQQTPSAGSNTLADIMNLAALYRGEDPAADSAVLEKLVFQLGRFFMALLPGATSDTVYILTSLCVTHIGKERLRDAERKLTKGAR